MGATGGACAWLRVVAQCSGFPTIGELSTDGFNGGTRTGNRKTHVLAQPVVGQTDPFVRDSTSEMGESLPSLFSPVSRARRAGRKMRLAGGNSRPPKKSNHGLVVTGSDVVSGGETSVVEKLNGYSGDLAGLRRGQDAPLPGGELTSRSARGPSGRAERTNEKKIYRNSVTPRNVTEEAFELDNAVVPTPAVFAGAVAPADSAGILFPAIAGMECPAVAEDLSMAVDVGGLPPAVRVRELLRPAAGVGLLSDIEATPSVELWGPAGPSSYHSSRGGNENGSPSDIVIELELLVCPGVGACRPALRCPAGSEHWGP